MAASRRTEGAAALAAVMRIAGRIADRYGAEHMPVLSCVRLRSGGSGLSVLATDLRITVDLRARMECGEYIEVLVDAALLSRIAASSRGEVCMSMAGDVLEMHVKGRMEIASLHCMPVDNMPSTMMRLEDGGCHQEADVGVGGPVDALFMAMRQVLHAVGGPSAQDRLRGVCLRHLGSGLVRVIGSDGHRLSVREVETDSGGLDDMRDLIIPADMVRHIGSFLSWSGGGVHAQVLSSDASPSAAVRTRTLALVAEDGSELQATALQSDYPDIDLDSFLHAHRDQAWAVLAPVDAIIEFADLAAHVSTVDHREMRMELMGRDGGGQVMRLEVLGEAGGVVRGVDVEVAQPSDLVAAGVAGDRDRCRMPDVSLLLALNAGYLLDAVKALGGEQVLIMGGGPEAPLLIYPCEIGGGIARACELIMPMKPGG